MKGDTCQPPFALKARVSMSRRSSKVGYDADDSEDEGKLEEEHGRRIRRLAERKYSYSSLGLKTLASGIGDGGSCFGLDIGGTLCKLLFFEADDLPEVASAVGDIVKSNTKYGRSGVRDEQLSFYSQRLSGTLHFIRFETAHIASAIDMASKLQTAGRISRIHATGGGSMKYAKLFKEKQGIKLTSHDELETVVRGIVFAILELPDAEFYTYSPAKESGLEDIIGSYQRTPFPIQVSHGEKFVIEDLFPFLVINIGSGVSILKVDSPTEFQRISGTALGGGTYYGLCKILNLCHTFDEAMDMAEDGDSRKVNLLVRDIYGGEWDKHGLSGDITASFFGKAVSMKRRRKGILHADFEVGFWERLGLVVVAFCCSTSVMLSWSMAETGLDKLRIGLLLLLPIGMAVLLFYPLYSGRSDATRPFENKDLSRALVVMVAQNVTQIAYLNARLHGTKRVVFTGNFLRHNPIAQYTLSKMMKQWSQDEIKCLYMKHEGYFGAIGAFLYSCSLKYEYMERESEDYDSSSSK